MAVGWLLNEAEATAYFATERPDADWAGVPAAKKTPYLLMAYNHINNHPDLSIPSSPTAAQLVKLKLAQEEQAWFLIINGGDQDRRKSVQTQGVIEAGIVKEKYDKDMLMDMPLSVIVWAILDSFKVSEGFMTGSNIDRDENESINYNATDF